MVLEQAGMSGQAMADKLAKVGQGVEGTSFAASGTSDDVSSLMSGKTSGGGATAKGVITSAPDNRCEILDDDYDEVYSTDDNRVYGRLTESGGTWTLSYYEHDEASGEQAFTMPSKTIRWIYQEVFDLADRPPVQVRLSDQLAGEIPDATDSVLGKQVLKANKNQNETLPINPGAYCTGKPASNNAVDIYEPEWDSTDLLHWIKAIIQTGQNDQLAYVDFPLQIPEGFSDWITNNCVGIYYKVSDAVNSWMKLEVLDAAGVSKYLSSAQVATSKTLFQINKSVFSAWTPSENDMITIRIHCSGDGDDEIFVGKGFAKIIKQFTGTVDGA